MQHLAQLNLARLKGTKDDAHMADFFANLDRINTLGDRMPGCVWRLKSEHEGEQVTVSVPADPMVAANLTVWESIEALEKFVWATVHTKFYNRKAEWFEEAREPYFVMWWIEAGHVPTLDEAMQRLEHLRRNGPSDHAFGWEDAPSAKLWREARCA